VGVLGLEGIGHTLLAADSAPQSSEAIKGQT
jgi:hypothetical protein